MAFTINPDGSITVGTAAELREVLALREETKREEPAKPSVPAAESQAPEPTAQPPATTGPRPVLPLGPPDSAVGYRRMFRELDAHDNQRNLLHTLASTERFFTDEELRSSLHLKTNLDLRGLMIGIIRRATNRNLPNPIVKEVTRALGGRTRLYRYSVTADFRRAISGTAGEKVAV